MSDVLNDFYDMFGLSGLVGADVLTFQDLVICIVQVCVSVAFVLVIFRFIQEFVKVLLDWSRWK